MCHFFHPTMFDPHLPRFIFFPFACPRSPQLSQAYQTVSGELNVDAQVITCDSFKVLRPPGVRDSVGAYAKRSLGEQAGPPSAKLCTLTRDLAGISNP